MRVITLSQEDDVEVFHTVKFPKSDPPRVRAPPAVSCQAFRLHAQFPEVHRCVAFKPLTLVNQSFSRLVSIQNAPSRDSSAARLRTAAPASPQCWAARCTRSHNSAATRAGQTATCGEVCFFFRVPDFSTRIDNMTTHALIEYFALTSICASPGHLLPPFAVVCGQDPKPPFQSSWLLGRLQRTKPIPFLQRCKMFVSRISMPNLLFFGKRRHFPAFLDRKPLVVVVFLLFFFQSSFPISWALTTKFHHPPSLPMSPQPSSPSRSVFSRR